MKKLSFSPKAVKPLEANPLAGLGNLDTRIALIQALIPVGLLAVEEVLAQEVVDLAGAHYQRKASAQPHRRWGQQPGSVYLADQKLPVSVPRVRNIQTHREVSLESYQALQVPRRLDEGLLLRILNGLSCRQYGACAEAVPEAFGLSPSTVSRRFIQASTRKLREFQERTLEDDDLVAVFFDGKTFAKEEMIIALGVTIEGEKIPLGFVQAASENERVCRSFIDTLIQRGLRYEAGLLVLIDGSKGLFKAITKALQGYVIIQRCQWHKRENVVAYLAPEEQRRVRKQLKTAYDQSTYEAARKGLENLKAELALVNQSALHSLEDGLEETLTLHRLGLMPYLKMSFRTTNCIESLNSQIAQRTDNVKAWKNSTQRHRWLAAALLDIQPRLRKVKGMRFLPLLREALQRELKLTTLTLSA